MEIQVSKQNSNKKKPNRQKRSSTVGKVRSGLSVFKPFHPTPVYRKLFRYKVGSAIVGQNITQNNIFAMWVCAQTVASARSIMNCMKIHSIRAIATGLSSTVTDELYIRDDNINGPVDPIDASSTGQGNAVVEWRPRKKSLGDDWFQSSTGTAICILSIPAGATIEFDVSFVINGAAGTGLTAQYTSTFVAGDFYSMGPDGAAGSIFYQSIGMNQA